MKSRIFLICLMLATMVACGGQGGGDEGPSRIDGEASPPTTERNNHGRNVRPSPFAFNVDVALSDDAKERIERSNESVIVAAMYYSEGKTGVPLGVLNDVGLVDIGKAQIELSGEGRAAFDGSAVLRERLDLMSGDLQINVNVFSGRRSSPDNLLDCDAFQGNVRAATDKPVMISCRLLVEEADGD